MIDSTLVIAFLVIFGVAMGSFVGAMVWRLRKQQLNDEKKHPVHTDKYSIVTGRSMCSHCEHPLAPIDLIPLLSWLSLGGRCRYCKKPIGATEPLLEASMAILFVVSYLVWPLPLETWYQWLDFGFWLVYVVLLVALFVYDLRWYILPDKLVWTLVGLALVNAVIQFIAIGHYDQWLEVLKFHVYGLLPIAGLYWFIYSFSGGRMIGFGDVKLGIFMGLVLGWEKALMVLLVANVLGGLVVLPLLLTKKLKRDSRVPFGPMLIVAFFIAGLWGDYLIKWYFTVHVGY